ncbi:MAG: hypothetical protein AAGB02_01655 [Pseudomonadota bacterium]
MTRGRVVGVVLLSALAGIGLANLSVYRKAATLNCSGPATVELRRGAYFLSDTLEVYVGGWIERGAVTMADAPMRRPQGVKNTRVYSAKNGVAEISHAYVGEHYDTKTAINFVPTDDASCRITILYRFR